MKVLCQICDLSVSPLEPTASITILVRMEFLLRLDSQFFSGQVVDLKQNTKMAQWLLKDVLELQDSRPSPQIVKWPSLYGRDPLLWTLDRVFLYYRL